MSSEVAPIDRSSYYLLLSDHTSEEVELYRAGTLWKAKSAASSLLATCSLVLEAPDGRTLVSADSSSRAELTWEQYVLLLAVRRPKDRLMVHGDRSWLQDGVLMKVGDRVLVFPKNDLRDGTPGILRYKGSLESFQGRWFGIEYQDEYRGRGTSDGTFRFQRYFKCADNSAVFVSLLKVRRAPEEGIPLVATALAGAGQEEGATAGHTADLQVGDRVVWLSDKGPEFATTLWLGPLSDLNRSDVYAGVDFDRPVGKGNGKYKGRQLFLTRKNHASLIPVMGLIRAEAYQRRSGEPGDAPNRGEFADSVAWRSASHGPLQNIVGQTTISYREDPPPLFSPEEESLGRSLTIGSKVEVLDDPPRFGRIRWIGLTPATEDAAHDQRKLLAGLEMEIPNPDSYTDGTFEGQRLFECRPHRGLFIHLYKCRPDRREMERAEREATRRRAQDRYLIECDSHRDRTPLEALCSLNAQSTDGNMYDVICHPDSRLNAAPGAADT